MKHYKAITGIVLSALLLVSCASEKAEIQEPAETETAAETTQAVTTVPKSTARPVTEAVTTNEQYFGVLNIPISRFYLPIIDCTETASPIMKGIKAKLLADPKEIYSYKERILSPDDTWFQENFIKKPRQLVFSEDLTETQQQAFEDSEYQHEKIPVAKEALVFIVSKDNPVNSLTQEQIRGIFSGEITNWSELGGNDAAIIPVQREQGSRSRNRMKQFMKDCDISDPVKNAMISGDYETVSTQVDIYDNAANAIGYTVSPYAVKLCENSGAIKLINVDGIKPSYKTMTDGAYPLTETISVYYQGPMDLSEEMLVKWLVSESGQRCIQESGYLPLKGPEYPDNLKLCETKGTGKKMPANYTPSNKISVISGSDLDVSFIKDEDFRNKVSSELQQNTRWSQNYLAFKNARYYGENGIVTFYLEYVTPEKKQVTKTFTYDLTEKRKITKYSDLFFKDSDFMPLVNKCAYHLITRSEKNDLWPDSDFMGITGEIKDFSVDGIAAIDNTKPFYSEENEHWFIFHKRILPLVVKQEYNLLPLAMITGEYHDFNDYVETDGSSCKVTEKYRHEWYYNHGRRNYMTDYDIIYDVVTGSLFHTKEEITQRNNVINKVTGHVVEKYLIEHPEYVKFANGSYVRARNYNYFLHVDNIYKVAPEWTELWSDYCLETDYYLNILSGHLDPNDYNLNEFNTRVDLFDPHSFFDHHYAGYDPETGDPLTFADIFGPEFSDIDESYALFTYSVSSKPDSSDSVKFIYGKPFGLEPEITVTEIPVDRKHLNMKYFISSDKAKSFDLNSYDYFPDK